MNLKMFLDALVVVILALIGGGIVNLFVDTIKSKRKSKAIKALLFSEIKMNLKIMDTKYTEDYPWIRHKSFNNFYEKYFVSVTEIDLTEEEIEKITEYYNVLEVLKERDKENDHLDSLLVKGKNDGAEFFQKKLGETKKELRDGLIKLSKEILSY